MDKFNAIVNEGVYKRETPFPIKGDTTIVQVFIPQLRANGVPSKRASLELSSVLPSEVLYHGTWNWRNTIVNSYSQPITSTHQFTNNTMQCFLPAYIPYKFHLNKMIWGNRMWFEMNIDSIYSILSTDQSCKLSDPNTWFHTFLEDNSVTQYT